LTKNLFIACAGAGKTTRIVKEAIEFTQQGFKVLIITYTRNNQNELINKFFELGGVKKDLFVVKGWYSFILEDVIRPYQRCIFSDRIRGIFLNSSNPHRNGDINIPGTAEKIDDKYNRKHFLNDKNQAYTEFISKLACRIITESKINISNRISDIYDKVYLDEAQDFAGWDFDLIKKISKSKKIDVFAVGDFRQTIYHTSSNPKKPSTSKDKLDEYVKMGFTVNKMNDCWRSVPSICSFADSVHQGEAYPETISKVFITKEITHHGIFYVSEKDIDSYIKKYKPLILRYSSATGKELEKYENLMTYGESKGCTCDHVLILPTAPIMKFLKKQLIHLEMVLPQRVKINFMWRLHVRDIV